ncbi:MAG TPA: hypothetical protein V6D02_01900 [Candidatus Obscuribacterales bacterium]
MDHKQQESRRRAARTFMNALDELESVLQSHPDAADGGQAAPPTPPPPARRLPPEEPDLVEWLDEAVQYIEQFMSDQSPTEDSE